MNSNWNRYPHLRQLFRPLLQTENPSLLIIGSGCLVDGICTQFIEAALTGPPNLRIAVLDVNAKVTAYTIEVSRRAQTVRQCAPEFLAQLSLQQYAFLPGLRASMMAESKKFAEKMSRWDTDLPAVSIFEDNLADGRLRSKKELNEKIGEFTL